MHRWDLLRRAHLPRLGDDGDSVSLYTSRRNSSRRSQASASSSYLTSSSSSYLTSSSVSGSSSMVAAYDHLLRACLAPFMRNSGALGGRVQVLQTS